jgi:flagellar hook-basal body complex protein FliE
MAIDTRPIDQMLSELRSAAALAGGKTPGEAAATNGPDFSQVLKSTIDQVNAAQQQAHKMAEDFSSGQSNVNLQDVMINLQKANLSFQQMVQVRNKLVSAYHDIMNIQVYTCAKCIRADAGFARWRNRHFQNGGVSLVCGSAISRFSGSQPNGPWAPMRCRRPCIKAGFKAAARPIVWRAAGCRRAATKANWRFPSNASS